MLDCLESSSSCAFVNGLLSAKPRLEIMDANPRTPASDLRGGVVFIIYKALQVSV